VSSRSLRALRNWQAHGTRRAVSKPRTIRERVKGYSRPQTGYGFIPHPGGESLGRQENPQGSKACEGSTPSARTVPPDTSFFRAADAFFEKSGQTGVSPQAPVPNA